MMQNNPLSCSICDNPYRHSKRRHPVSLPSCGHTFCRKCLINVKMVEGNVKCPHCRIVHEGPGPQDLPPNWALLNQIEQDVPIKDDSEDELQKNEPSSGSDAHGKPKVDPSKDPNKSGNNGFAKKLAIGAVVGGAATVIAAPLVLTGIGFTSAGIAAGSWAASMMSSAAIANGGGVVAGGAVALLQSAGAAGIPLAANAALAAGGAVVGGAAAGGAAAAAAAANRAGTEDQNQGSNDKEDKDKKK